MVTQRSKRTDADIARVQSAAQEAVDQHQLPGLAIGVVREDELVFAGGYGFADIESRQAMTPQHRHRIGSTTKTMVGLCAMALVDEGKLSLDDLVAERVPDVTLHGHGAELRIRHLLTHTGGIGELPAMQDFLDRRETLWSDAPDVAGVPECYPNGIDIEVPPGTKWAYANHGFVLLGEIVARAEGAPIEDVLARRIFAPLGMADSDLLDRPHAALSTGYHRAPTEDERALARRFGMPDPPEERSVDGHNIRGHYQYIRGRSAGAVQSTIPDMARYASALLRRGAGIVRPETFDAMIAPQWCPDDRLTSLGLAFMREPQFGRRSFHHGGGVMGGWGTMLTVFPDDGLAVLLHCNLAYAKIGEVVASINRAALSASADAAAPSGTDAGLLQHAIGVYEAPEGTLTNFRIISGSGRVQVTAREGSLWLRSRHGPWAEERRLLPADANDPAFFALETAGDRQPHVAFVRDRAGVVQGMRFDPCTYMVRNAALEPWA